MFLKFRISFISILKGIQSIQRRESIIEIQSPLQGCHYWHFIMIDINHCIKKRVYIWAAYKGIGVRNHYDKIQEIVRQWIFYDVFLLYTNTHNKMQFTLSQVFQSIYPLAIKKTYPYHFITFANSQHEFGITITINTHSNLKIPSNLNTNF